MSDGKSVEIHLPSELGFEKLAMSTAAGVAALMGFSPDRIEDLKTAVGEACINAMEHGNRMDDCLRIGVELSKTDTTLEVKVSDEGTGPSKDPAQPDIDRKMSGEEETRGMGMFLIRALVDEAEWHQGPPGSSYLRLLLRLGKENE
jgi:serine/threonine-protein kinase RsbW